MAVLAECIRNAGFSNVQTYIQSGNIVLDTEMGDQAAAGLIHEVILKNIGADLSVIVKDSTQLKMAIEENPFGSAYDRSRIHLVFTNDLICKGAQVFLEDFGEEILREGSACFYMYLPRGVKKKRLNTNYLERRFGITATMRKLSVIEHLCDMACI